MPSILLRVLPWTIALLGVLLAEWQWRAPGFYPLPFVIGGILYIAASALLIRRRLSVIEVATALVPTLIFMAATSLGALIAEQVLERVLIDVFFSIVPAFSLELLYLSLYEKHKYPVNGQSRLNMALVPLIGYLLGTSLNGLQIFMRMSFWVTVLVLPLVGAALAVVTEHPSANRMHNLRWTGLGALIGLHAAAMTILLPVPLPVHGALTAILFSVPLRIRRYGHAPVPARSLAWGEGITVALAFVAVLLTSRWA